MVAVSDFEASVAARDSEGVQAAFTAMRTVFPKARRAEVVAAGRRLAGLLAQAPPMAGGMLAVLIGACVERGADADVCGRAVLDGTRAALEGAALFAERWAAGGRGELPDPEETEPVDDTFDLLGGREAAEARRAISGWWTLPQWEMAAVAMLSYKQVRSTLRDRAELLALADRVGRSGDLRCLRYALKVLDGESLIALHRETRTGYLLRMTGIADNFQLHTLLAGALVVPGHVPGRAPSAREIAVCRDVEVALSERPPAVGTFNLVSPDGSWIWNEGTPSDIPVVDGVRLLVLDPPPYERAWPAGRFFPRMRADLVLERVLSPEEADACFARVSEAGTTA